MKKLRILGVVVVVVLVLGGGLSWFAQLLDTRSWCVISSEWAHAHAQSLPGSLSDYLTIPKAYRSAVWTNLPADTKSGIMQAAFRQIDTSTLSAAQAEALAFAAAELTPEFYGLAEAAIEEARALGVSFRNLNPPILQRSTEVHNRLRAAFTDAELMKILPRFLPQTYTMSMSLFRATLVAGLRSIAPPVLADARPCACWDTSDCSIRYGGDYRCFLFNACSNIGLLCQFPEDIPCDGVCSPPVIQ